MISVVGKFLYRSAETCLAGRQVVDDGGDDLLECFQGLADSDEGWSGPHVRNFGCISYSLVAFFSRLAQG